MKDLNMEIARSLDKLVQIQEYRANIERLMLEKEGMRIPKLVIADNFAETPAFTEKNVKAAKKIFEKVPDIKIGTVETPIIVVDKKD